eukprot:CAMPEP_0201281468 /NCGR_PEP_ID=MMETSP1317-20130820/2812_1 /ASSEMBLY_ACC=CAM_ASM_000770 /TAXON_ID=187299 /ORGANISM="Undescribed Undescribed, Strain Undescribed" /LENGTH=79 /DNA_ID=CAMNT_0047591285 /DNA_START=311 /DNA_END=550 /DNA_ORIENTATION=+
MEGVRVLQQEVPLAVLLAQGWAEVHWAGDSSLQLATLCTQLELPYELQVPGFNPCIVDSTAQLSRAAQQICLNKFHMAG